MDTPMKDGQLVGGQWVDMNGRFVFVPADAPVAMRILELERQHQNRLADAYSSLANRFGGAPVPQRIPFNNMEYLNEDALELRARNERLQAAYDKSKGIVR